MRHSLRAALAACLLLALFAAAAPDAGTATPATQTPVEHLDSREALTSASEGLSTIDFEAVAPARGFGMYRPPAGLSTGGVHFRVTGGARFGPGNIYVPSVSYMGTNPLYQTGTGALLSWSVPNQPGNASLELTLPAGTTAFGADLWTQQPYVSTVEVTATDTEGRAQTVVVGTRGRPAPAFVGFISEAALASVSFRPPRGQTGLFLDNVSFGRRAEGRRVRPSAAGTAQNDAGEAADAAGQAAANRPAPAAAGQTPPPAAQPASTPAAQQAASAAANQPTTPETTTPAGQPPASGAGQTDAPAPAGRQNEQAPASASNAQGRGTIAYVRGGKEIRLVEADGSNDRRLWTHPQATEGAEIHDLAWRPDGAELAFSSSHNSVVSFYHADIYGVRPDGTGFRKITNAPDHGELARYPKGAVQVTVRNDQPFYQRSQASAGVFFVYVAGADEPQAVTLPPGSSRTLLFKSVADFGDHAQPVVAMYGRYRWFIPGLDVKAGRTTAAPVFGISGDGHELFGAFRPTWRADGSRLSHRGGLCLTNSTPARPTPGEYVFRPLFAGTHPSGVCSWDWGPTPALADQIIYTANSDADGSAVYRIREGGTHPGQKLHTFSELNSQFLLDLRWLPDGSGFLYSFPDLAYEFGNIFRYDFATKRVTPLTNYEGEYARRFDISPDGAWVVFERARKWDDDKGVDLWLMRSDGRGARLLVRDATAPSWR